MFWAEEGAFAQLIVMLWLAMAVMVSTRLWLAASVSQHRDAGLISLISSYPLERMGVILLLLSKLSIPRRGNADLSLESLAKCYF
jgi:hypothetical protein